MSVPQYIRKQILPGVILVIRLDADDTVLSKVIPGTINQLAGFWKSSQADVAQRMAATKISKFWETNVYRVYTKHSGNLGRACVIDVQPGRIDVGLGRLYHVHNYQGFRMWEYSRYIQNGFGQSSGAYSPRLGVRIKRGTHPGVPQSKFWKPWLNIFRPNARRIYRQSIKQGLVEYTNAVLAHKSIMKRTTGWTSIGMKEQFFVSQPNAIRGGWK